jgi:hypothetical protein
VKCGNNVTARGDYAKAGGPAVVVLGSVEDLRRAQQAGDIDTSDDDPNALGWLDSEEVDAAPVAPAEAKSQTRRVSVREIDKISGLKDLRDIQKALLDAETGSPAPPKETVKPSKIERGPAPRSRDVPTVKEPSKEAPSREAPAKSEEHDEVERPRDAGPVAAYLVGELFPEPFGLTLKRKYLMGRDPRASIFLPGGEVSRRHAGIAADEKGAFWVEDLRSANGTYVNGHAVLKRKLRDGDRLDVGPFSFTFAPAADGKPAPKIAFDPNEETRVIRAMPGSLTAEIDTNGVLPLLRLLHERGRSGVMTLRAGKQVGRIFLIEGEVHHAQFGKYKGDDALAALLPAEVGSIHFQDEKVKVPRTVQRMTDEILTDGR